MTHPHDDPADSPRRGMRANGAASSAELREFLSRMRGKPPQEVLGLIAQSGLARAMFLSTLLTLALLAATTVIPFAWNKMAGGGAQQAATKAAAEKRGAGQASGEQTGAAKTESAATSTAAATSAKTADPKEAALSKLGVGEAKKASGNVNPLEGRADDILKDFDKK